MTARQCKLLSVFIEYAEAILLCDMVLLILLTFSLQNDAQAGSLLWLVAGAGNGWFSFFVIWICNFPPIAYLYKMYLSTYQYNTMEYGIRFKCGVRDLYI